MIPSNRTKGAYVHARRKATYSVPLRKGILEHLSRQTIQHFNISTTVIADDRGCRPEHVQKDEDSAIVYLRYKVSQSSRQHFYYIQS